MKLILKYNQQSSKRHKEDWLKAFRKVKNLQIIQTNNKNEIVNISEIGVSEHKLCNLSVEN